MVYSKEEAKKYWDNYYKKNRDKIIKKTTQYQKENPEKKRVIHKRWRQKNLERLRQYMKQHYQENKEHRKEYYKEYREKYPEKAAAQQHAFRNKQKDTKCCICKAIEQLHFHHTNYEKREGDTLCSECHMQIHSPLGLIGSGQSPQR